jgi:mannose/fructose-specific phosphotransferase system component IIA
MEVNMTERAEFTFIAMDFVSGTPWNVAEQLSGDMPTLRGTLGFELAAGTTLNQTNEIAKYMREHIRGLSFTK